MNAPDPNPNPNLLGAEGIPGTPSFGWFFGGGRMGPCPGPRRRRGHSRLFVSRPRETLILDPPWRHSSKCPRPHVGGAASTWRAPPCAAAPGTLRSPGGSMTPPTQPGSPRSALSRMPPVTPNPNPNPNPNAPLSPGCLQSPGQHGVSPRGMRLCRRCSVARHPGVAVHVSRGS